MRLFLRIFTPFLLYSTFSSAQNWPVQVKFISAVVENDSILEWKAIEIKEPFQYIVQQFRWNRWVDWDTLKNSPGKDSAGYSFNVAKYIFGGMNKFRLRAVNAKILDYSKAVSFNSTRKPPKKVSGHYGKKNNQIDFGRNECFEIYDKDGKLIRKGYARTVDVGDLPKGDYFLNYENISSEFIIS